MTWRVPVGEWSGAAVHILGGGPSLSRFDASALRGRIIGINEAGLTLAPSCDILFWADTRWLEWNVDRLGLHVGERKVCRQRPDEHTPKCPPETKRKVTAAIREHRILTIGHERKAALSHDAGRLAGIDSGGSAINLAVLLGGGPIYLHGFDMKPGHFHSRHPVTSKAHRYAETFIPSIERMAKSLAARGIDVINCTPDSALRCFPFRPLSEVL